jgi:hypothetical protein
MSETTKNLTAEMLTKIIPSARPQAEGFWSLLRLVIRHCLRGVTDQDWEPDDESELDSYFAVLNIHESGTERKPLTQDRYNKVWLKCQERFVQQIL